MNCFYFSQYRFYQPRLKRELSFFMISDVHFSRKVKDGTLYAISNQAAIQKPNYIIIAGDLIDSLDCIDSEYELSRLVAWLRNLGEIATTVISLGNHDFYRKNYERSSIFSTRHRWYFEKPDRLIEAVKNIKNIYILDNEVYEDEDAYIFGFTPSSNYYEFDSDKKDRDVAILNSKGENFNILLADFSNLESKFTTKLPKKKVKIMTIHSPVFLDNAEIISKLREFDYIVSGHMHNGVVPPILNDLWRSDRGLIAPGKRFFPHNARTHITGPSDKKIILGPVTTIQESSRPLTFLNHVFPVNVAPLELTHDVDYRNKPDVKYRYVRFWLTIRP